jgi:hypothetical protein
VVDIRPEANRRAEGELAGAVVVERIHLEWRLDPTSPHRIAEVTPGQRAWLWSHPLATVTSSWSVSRGGVIVTPSLHDNRDTTHNDFDRRRDILARPAAAAYKRFDAELTSPRAAGVRAITEW